MNDELLQRTDRKRARGWRDLRGEIAPSRRRDISHEQQKNVVLFILAALSLLALVVLVRLVQET